MNHADIVVTGLGLICGQGLSVAQAWRGVVDGASATRRFTLFDPDGLACTFGVELPDAFDRRLREIKPRTRKQMSRSTAIQFLTAQDAIGDAGLREAGYDRSRIGVVFGTTGPAEAATESNRDYRILRNMSNAPAAWISIKNNFTGPASVAGAACASGIYALHAACLLLQAGVCDAVVTGAADSSLNYRDVEGFCSLMALAEPGADSSRASRPFDSRRSGFVIAEGGGALVLERRPAATQRGAHIYARTFVPGVCSESYNILAPRPGGAGMAKSMRLALAAAGLAPGDIDYINAHGASTALNDRYETQAIKEVFGAAARIPPVSSTKSTTGHALAGAAGIEMALCCKALEEGLIPQTAHYGSPDPDCDLDYVPNASRPADLRAVMCNSFAFGGHNGACIFVRDA
jgi:3-oxoacyl-[acyl-carrier-protein] synthase II